MTFALMPYAGLVKSIAPQHKKIYQLFKRIEQQKEQLAVWQQAQSRIEQKVRQDLFPLYQSLYALWSEQLECLWQNVQHPELTKLEQQALDEKTAQRAQRLENAKWLSADQQAQAGKIAEFYRQLYEKSATAETPVQQTEHIFDEQPAEVETWEKAEYQAYKTQAKQQREQQKKAQAAAKVAQSLKTVYLKVTAMIHPDREPDEDKKIAKTTLFQQVNTAYEQEDLFYLLQLQLTLEQEQAGQKAGMAESQIKLLQLALEHQSQQLQQQIDDILEGFVLSKTVKSELEVYQAIAADVKSLKQQITWEKQRLKYMGKIAGIQLLLAEQAL